MTVEANDAALTGSSVGAGKPVADRSGKLRPMLVCGGAIASDRDIVDARSWTWVGTRIPYVEHAAFAYRSIPGDKVVAQARKLSTSCKSYTQEDEFAIGRLVVDGQDVVKAPAGLDGFYAFCETSTTTRPIKDLGRQATICTAVMSKASIVVTVRVFGKVPTLKSAQSALLVALAPAAKALGTAVTR